MNEKVDLKNLDLSEMTDFLTEFGVREYRARQIFKWVFKRGVTTIQEMTDIPLSFRDELADKAFISTLRVVKELLSKDLQTRKYLFQLEDGDTVESVLMKQKYGSAACVSTQVGCRMGCIFCASTHGGLARNLNSAEIYEQVLKIQEYNKVRVGNVVLMGMGEPLENLDNVLKFIDNVTSPLGLDIGMRKITLSTCGIVPGIRLLAKEKLQLTLAVSLHAPNNELRNRFMPVNRKYPLEELLDACREYIQLTGRRITFEYALIEGINDSVGTAHELAEVLGGLLCHINLIPINPSGDKKRFRRTNKENIYRFAGILEKSGFSVTVRREMGGDIEAACGQLRRRFIEGKQ
ncbi:MAG TPA: 23S rRNA (adenine(2503)-C(2))-methyltransferase RlmN [Clostridia bacterium]|nr:23S rRNA (adenine(2503)-C(2))-methyltransferase RlmN [Clostridia bacterium]